MPTPKWLKPTVDFGPLAVFLLAFWTQGLLVATAALMIATAVVLILSFSFTRKVALVPLTTAVVVGIFGGLTLYLHDDTFIKIKPTIIYALFALAIGGGLLFDKPAAKAILGEALRLTDTGWRRLSFRFMLFCVAMAVANEIVRRVAPVDVWVLWKVPGSLVTTFVFMLAQMPLIQRHKPAEQPVSDKS